MGNRYSVRCSALGFFNRLENRWQSRMLGALCGCRVGGPMAFDCCGSSAPLSRLSGPRSDSDATRGRHVSERYAGSLGPSLPGMARHPDLARRGRADASARSTANMTYASSTGRPDSDTRPRPRRLATESRARTSAFLYPLRLAAEVRARRVARWHPRHRTSC